MNFSFYNVYIEKNSNLTYLSLNNLLDHISVQNPRNKTVKLDDDCYYSLPQYIAINNQCRIFWLGKFLKNKPYNGHIGSDNIEEIVGDAYQPVICLYDEVHRMLVVEGTIAGPKKKGIENFLNSYICKENEGNDNYYHVKLIQQRSEKGLEIVDNDTEILRILIQVKINDYNVQNFINQDEDDEEQNFIGTLLGRNVEFGNEFGANVLTLEFKKGRYAGDLDNTIINLMQAINSEDISLLSGLIDVRLGNGTKTQIDLRQRKFINFYKNVGDITGFDALMIVLRDALTNNEFSDDAINYSLEHYAGEISDCNDAVAYKDIPYGGLEDEENEEIEEEA
ncbi:hypothetical protein FC19_GL001452 [Liquorilactobacillus aquaticus DSM 21051]|uniref:Uncharacterized protein n=1 Tax=Liquorilactobacillus aquaticus DSM 21051 TaxID=1423725 RepID=A0A0R2D7J4_9LACO|nr:hypothetical protein [Liquorilactobacillus aquaticus]KRM95971.1 hypothetical protein FC19_GL001452 [Liquorilactobacillus aquaticus DSM 21051]